MIHFLNLRFPRIFIELIKNRMITHTVRYIFECIQNILYTDLAYRPIYPYIEVKTNETKAFTLHTSIRIKHDCIAVDPFNFYDRRNVV